VTAVKLHQTKSEPLRSRSAIVADGNKVAAHQLEAIDNVRTVPGIPLSHEIWLEFLNDGNMSEGGLPGVPR
jgi:hypothetical protein